MIVYVVDDDDGIRDSIAFVLKKAGIAAKVFDSPARFLEEWDESLPGCLVVDYKMPDLTGLQLIQEIRSRGSMIPFLIITGHGTVPIAVEAMRMGAVTVIEKPFHHKQLLELLESLRQAMENTAKLQEANRQDEHLAELIELLTPREREIMELVVQGLLSKQIAKSLGISIKTVEVHRSHITRKLQVESVAQLVSLVMKVRNRTPQPSSQEPW